MPTTKHWTTEPDAEVNIKVSVLSLPAQIQQQAMHVIFVSVHIHAWLEYYQDEYIKFCRLAATIVEH